MIKQGYTHIPWEDHGWSGEWYALFNSSEVRRQGMFLRLLEQNLWWSGRRP